MSHPDSDFTVEAAIRIVRSCLAAQQPDKIVPALMDRRSPESVEAELNAGRPTQPTAATPAARAGRDLLGGEPTPQQRDALASALQHRLQQMYPKRGQ